MTSRRAFTLCIFIGSLMLTGSQSRAQGFRPDEAAKRMTLPEGLIARPYASEPMIRQPVCVEFDDRGRLWVVQYLQYPNPAGLERRQVDRYSRTVYDRIPEPPPHGPRGADRLTILEDTDHDGQADRAKDFVGGLNLASGLAFGRGGVYVLQVPYLLFYSDQNRDDVPDGDPEVLLKGFGMEDAHSVANSLTWGPDGWLYGLQGSTVTANIRGAAFQQGVWRYHPESRRFELFCEGGGNMWGLDFDRHGRLFASTNVGGHALLHAVQGTWCWKSFAKHGELHNPFAYGYFEHAPHQGASREGHVTVGGLIYEADALPANFRGKYVAGDLLGHAVRWHAVEPDGSSVRTRLEGDLLAANDTWFAPSDLTQGPDGAIYVADWHDQRTAHPDPDAAWDRSNGRVYAVTAPGHTPAEPIDLQALDDDLLLERLSHPNSWHVRRARRILSERRDPRTMAKLKQLAVQNLGHPRPIEAVWTLAAAGVLDRDDELARRLLQHADENVRAWTVRVIGDREKASAALVRHIRELADTETSCQVRAQLASTARRLTPADGLAIAGSLLKRDQDLGDPHIPLLIWWAIERHASMELTQALDLLTDESLWRSRLNRREILPRLLRRMTAMGTKAGDSGAARFLRSMPAGIDAEPFLAALGAGLRERPANAIGPGAVLLPQLIALGDQLGKNSLLVSLMAKLGDQTARANVEKVAFDPGGREADRVPMIRLFSELPFKVETSEKLLDLVDAPNPRGVQLAALDALSKDERDSTADRLIAKYPRQDEVWRARARGLLLGRKSWARRFLDAVDRGDIEPSRIPDGELRPVALHGDPKLDAIVRAHWGTVSAGTPEEKLAEVRRLNNDLRAAAGDPDRGRQVFLKRCASCHAYLGEGKPVGPNLDEANRGDREYLLVSLVDPGAVIRKEFVSSVVSTRDGRLLTGIVRESAGGRLSIIGPDDTRVELDRGDVEEIRDSPVSLMPEGLYRELTPQDLRDLFSHLGRARP